MPLRLPLDSDEFSSFSGVMSGEILDSLLQQDLSSETLEYDTRKLQLQALVSAMAAAAPSWDAEDVVVNPDTVAAARRFLLALPNNRELPKVSPDGEGDLLFVWEPPHGDCIVTVQAGVLHMVDQPGTPHVEHIDDQVFTGLRIPITILHAIPFR